MSEDRTWIGDHDLQEMYKNVLGEKNTELLISGSVKMNGAYPGPAFLGRITKEYSILTDPVFVIDPDQRPGDLSLPHGSDHRIGGVFDFGIKVTEKGQFEVLVTQAQTSVGTTAFLTDEGLQYISGGARTGHMEASDPIWDENGNISFQVTGYVDGTADILVPSLVSWFYPDVKQIILNGDQFHNAKKLIEQATNDDPLLKNQRIRVINRDNPQKFVEFVPEHFVTLCARILTPGPVAGFSARISVNPETLETTVDSTLLSRPYPNVGAQIEVNAAFGAAARTGIDNGKERLTTIVTAQRQLSLPNLSSFSHENDSRMDTVSHYLDHVAPLKLMLKPCFTHYRSIGTEYSLSGENTEVSLHNMECLRSLVSGLNKGENSPTMNWDVHFATANLRGKHNCHKDPVLLMTVTANSPEVARAQLQSRGMLEMTLKFPLSMMTSIISLTHKLVGVSASRIVKNSMYNPHVDVDSSKKVIKALNSGLAGQIDQTTLLILTQYLFLTQHDGLGYLPRFVQPLEKALNFYADHIHEVVESRLGETNSPSLQLLEHDPMILTAKKLKTGKTVYTPSQKLFSKQSPLEAETDRSEKTQIHKP